MMRIAFILPSLANRGPILVVRDLVTQLQLMGHFCKVFYFDDLPGVEFSSGTEKLPFKGKYSFEGFDVVHSHGLRPDVFIYRNKASIKAVCVSTMHNIIIEEYKSTHHYLFAWCVQTVWTHYLKRHDALVCLTRQMCSYYAGLVKKKPQFVVYNGRSIEEFSELTEAENDEILRFKKDYKILGSACVVTKRKGLHQVIQALPLLKDYAFILIGDGPELEGLKALAKDHDVADRCLFLGSKDQAYRFYSYFDLFVMASYTEGVPLSLLEAAAVKLPALCSDIEVLREIFTEDEVSFFNLDDTGSFVAAAEYAMASYSKYASAIYECYQAKYTSKSMAVNYETVYQNLIQKK